MKSATLCALFIACVMTTQIHSFSWRKWGNTKNWGRSLNVANDEHHAASKQGFNKWKQAHGKIISPHLLAMGGEKYTANNGEKYKRFRLRMAKNSEDTKATKQY